MKKIFVFIGIFVLSQFVPQRQVIGRNISVLKNAGFRNDVLPLMSKIQNSKTKIQNSADHSDSVIDTLTWRKEGASRVVNQRFVDPYDSLLVWFNPVASCSLLAIRFRPMDWEGNILFNIWDASNYDPLIYSTDSTDENGYWGKYEPSTDPSGWIPGDIVGHTPLGWRQDDPHHHYWGPYPFSVTSELTDSWIEVPADSWGQGIVNLGDDPFYIGAAFFPTGGWGFYAQEPYPRKSPFSFFKYYGCEQICWREGWYLLSYFPWFEAIVKYYENKPPAYHDLKEQSYTYFSGPYPITVGIEDFDAEDGNMAGVAAAELVYTVNGFEERTLMVGPAQGGLFTAEIPQIGIGDMVTYWIEATDLHGLSARSDEISFERIEPLHPDADILILWDYWKDESLDSFVVDLFNTFKVQYEYELWNITQRNGIDASVIHWGWNTIYITGWGSTNTLPGRDYDGDLFVGWLEAGSVEESHNLLFFDQDYFSVHSEYGWNEDNTLSPGDFLYDYFGVVQATSENHGMYPTDYDSVAIGAGEFDGVRVNFLPDKVYPYRPQYNLWADWILDITDEAEQIFYYKDHPEYGAGVRLDRRQYKTCFLPWPDFFAFDSLEKGDLVPRRGLTQTVETILEWFGTEASRDDRCRGLVGDPTGDGAVNVSDVLAVVHHIIGKAFLEEDGLCRGDCNGDAFVDVLDVVGIVRVILGLGQCEP